MSINEKFSDIPADVVVTIKKCAKKARIPLEDAERRFISHFEQDSLNFIDDPIKRYNYAAKLLEDDVTPLKYIQGYPVTYNVDFSVLDFTSIREYQTKKGKPMLMASVFGAFSISEDNDASAPPSIPMFGTLTLKGDGCKILEHLKRGGTYKLSLLIKTRSNRLELSKTRYEVPEDVNIAFPEPKDLVIKAFSPIDPNKASKHLGYNKLIRGVVIKYQIKQTKNGQRIGITEISDVSTSFSNKDRLSVLWFSEPEFAKRYNIGSTCYFLVDIKENETGYVGLTVIGTCVIPVFTLDDVEVQELSEWI